MKKLELEISKCDDCPYCQYDDYEVEMKCMNSEIPFKVSNRDIIHEDCNLPNKK